MHIGKPTDQRMSFILTRVNLTNWLQIIAIQIYFYKPFDVLKKLLKYCRLARIFFRLPYRLYFYWCGKISKTSKN